MEHLHSGGGVPPRVQIASAAVDLNGHRRRSRHTRPETGRVWESFHDDFPYLMNVLLSESFGAKLRRPEARGRWHTVGPWTQAYLAA